MEKMGSINIFLNKYKGREDNFTYNFLALVDFLNDRKLCEFLSGTDLSEEPLRGLRAQYWGSCSKPDGAISLMTKQKKELSVFIENKLDSSPLYIVQIKKHILTCVREEEWRLLVITPRVEDKSILDEIGDSRILFLTWKAILVYLKDNFSSNRLATQFVEYVEKKKYDSIKVVKNKTKRVRKTAPPKSK